MHIPSKASINDDVAYYDLPTMGSSNESTQTSCKIAINYSIYWTELVYDVIDNEIRKEGHSLPESSPLGESTITSPTIVGW